MPLKKTGVELVVESKQQFMDSMQDANKAVDGFASEAEKAGGRVAGFASSVSSNMSLVGTAVVGFAATGIAALAGFAAKSADIAGDYEATLNRFAAVTGEGIEESGKSLDDFSAKFLQLGIDTQFSAAEAAEAAVELAKGGRDAGQVYDELADVLALAAAGELGLATSAEIAAKQLGVWGDTGVTAAEVADLLAQAANASTVGVEDLAIGLANAGGTAKAAGVDYQDFVQTLALIAPNFSSASDAGTSYKTFLARLIPVTKNQTDAMIELGLATEDGKSLFFDSEGAFIGMAAAAELLKEQTAGLSEEEKLLAFNLIFGQDAIRTAVALSEAGAAGFDAMGASMAGAGSAAEQAALRNQGFNFAMDQLKGSVETLMIVVGTGLLPILTSFIQQALLPGLDAAVTFAQALLGNADAMATLKDPLAAIAGALLEVGATFADAGFMSMEMTETLGLLHPALGAVHGLFRDLLPAIQPLVGIIQENLQPILISLAGVIGASVVVALGGMIASLVTAAAPILALVAAGAVLVKAWQEDWLGIQTMVTSAVGAVLPIVDALLRAFRTFGGGALQEIIAFVQGGETEFENLRGLVSSIVDTLAGAIAGLVGFIQAELPGWVATLADWGAAAVQWVIDAIPPLLEQAGEWAGQILAFVQARLPDWLETLGGWGAAAVQWVIDAIPPLLEQLGEWAAQILAFLAENLPGWTAALLEWATAAVQWIADAIPPLIEKAGEFLGALLEWAIGTALPELVEAAEEWTDALWLWIVEDLIPAVGPALLEFLGTMLVMADEINTAMVKAAIDIGKGIVEGIMDGLEALADELFQAAMELAQKAVEAAKSVLGIQSPSTVFEEIGRNIGQGLIAGVLATEGDMEDAVNQLLDIGGTLGGIGGSLARVYEQQVLDPLEEKIQEQDASIENLQGQIDERLVALFGEDILGTLNAEGNFGDLQVLLRSGQIQDEELERLANMLLIFEDERAASAEEYRKEQERILELQEKQQQLDLLKQQMALLDLLNEYDLSASEILQGLELGIDADVGAVIDAMTRAMEEIVEQSEAALGIASPSKKFMEIGRQTMAGLAEGIHGALGLVAGAAGEAGSLLVTGARTLSQPATAGQIASSTVVSNSTTYALTMQTTQGPQSVQRGFAVLEALSA